VTTFHGVTTRDRSPLSHALADLVREHGIQTLPALNLLRNTRRAFGRMLVGEQMATAPISSI
jgi:hypothetical protein